MVKRAAETNGAAVAATTPAKRLKKVGAAPGKAAKAGKSGAGDDIIKLDPDDDDDDDGGSGDAPRSAKDKERAIPVAAAKKAAKKAAAKLDVRGAFGRANEERPRVLYIGHVPHGFYEDQMRAYFGQFGEVTRLRLSRNKKTGRSKHYAYVEFKHPEVAEIVAESMDNYLLFESVIKVRLMANEECHAELWKGANRKFKKVPWQKKAAEVHDRERTEAESATQAAALLRGERRRRRLIKEAGIEYDFPGYAAAADNSPDAPVHTKAPKAAAPKVPKPVADAPKSAAKAPKSAAKAAKPAAEAPKSAAKAAKPAAEAPEPAVAAVAPTSAAKAPKSPAKTPKPAAEAPKPAAKTPKSAVKAPEAAKTPSKRAATDEVPVKTPAKKAKTPGKTPTKAKTPK